MSYNTTVARKLKDIFAKLPCNLRSAHAIGAIGERKQGKRATKCKQISPYSKNSEQGDDSSGAKSKSLDSSFSSFQTWAEQHGVQRQL